MSEGDTAGPEANSVAEARAEAQARRGALRAEREARIAEAFPGEPPGRAIAHASWAATVALGVVSVLALLDADRFLTIYFVVTFTLFALGALLLAVDVVLAAVRSTTHSMGIGGLFFLADAAPRPVQLSLNASLAVSLLVSVSAAVIGLSTPELAFGTLVPTLQLSLSGLWGVRHGLFPERNHGADGHRGSASR